MTTSHTQDFSTTALMCVFRGGPVLEQFGLPDLPWALPSSGVFGIVVDGQHISGQSTGLSVRNVTVERDRSGRKHRTATVSYDTLGLEIEQHIVVYDGMALAEAWLAVRNAGEQTRRITRLDSLALELPPDAYELLSFTGAWGSEFEPQRAALAGDVILESRSGRSSFGNHPWFALTRAGTSIFSGAVAWSGNWVFRLERRDDGGYTLSGGLHDWEFASDLGPGESIEAPPVVLALAKGTDLNQISIQYAAVGRRFWYPHNRLSDTLPVEWNHWWSYEDRLITEQVFRANVDMAAQLGMEVCALDAGWFGPTDPATHWYDYRGDWDMVNAERFPSGIRALSDYVHSRGMAFGLWCEIEGLGARARLAETHPELVATRDGERLGYVCLGSDAGRAWAFATLDRLIGEYGSDWIKLDFNLDPGAGCNRTDHGHGAGDGLYAHYQGYYQLLERVRERYPEAVLENCSSGGLRIDLGIARRTHMAFLSDPDWPEHSLQLFWGASAMLAPDACLHWGYCEWTFAKHPHQHFDSRDPALQPHQLDYYTRISMLRRFGFSQKLPELPGWVADRYRGHIADYKAHVRRFVGQAELHRLTEQPLRDGRGERWAAFQYRQPDGGEHLLAVFRLHGGEERRTIRLVGLEADRLYTIIWLGGEREQQANGAELMQQGLLFTDLQEEGSALMLVR
jgi:alpha-galactosidase